MSDIMLNNGDILNTIFGDVSVANEDEDIIQSAINNVLTIYGENEFHPDLGNTIYNDRNKLSSSNLVLIQDACKSAIELNDDRVKQVTSITATKDADIYGSCIISFILETTDSKVLSSSTTIVL